MKYNEEENAILEAYDNGYMKLSSPSEDEIKAITEAAKSTFKKDQRVTLRLYSHDFHGIQKKAMEMGIPYQTLISGVIHQYLEGDLKPVSR